MSNNVVLTIKIVVLNNGLLSVIDYVKHNNFIKKTRW